MEKVLITGGTGLIGTYLRNELHRRGYGTVILSRRSGTGLVKWDVENEFIASDAFDGVNHIIHLAGENVADKRWSEARKKSILESRTKSAQLILNELQVRNIHLKTFVSASAVGYYGTVTGDILFVETTPGGNDFLADVCQKWEQSALALTNVADRVCILRTGLVLALNGGLLKRLLLPAKMGISVVFGDGKQFMPWIHIKDLCNMYIKSIEDGNFSGIYNAVSPNSVTNREFSDILGKALNKRQLIIKIPQIVVSIIFGELGQVLVSGSKISAKKIIEAAYEFEFTDLEKAFRDLI
ncbi:MAG: TIGR01777 family oxidoreductase [bacterium]